MRSPLSPSIGLAAALLMSVLWLPAPAQTRPRFTNTPVRAVITVGDKENGVLLAGRTDTDLFYSPPNVPEGVYGSFPLADIQNARLEFTIDNANLNKAILTRRWREAAGLILRTTEPTLPYLDLPGNEAAEWVATASTYLMNAAALAQRGGPEGIKSAAGLLTLVIRLSDRLQTAAWFYGAEAARLRAAQALTTLGRLEEAGRRMEDAAVPEPGDGDFGLYWLTRATLAEARGETLEALDAAARSLAFDNKNPETFGPALLLYARACEQGKDWYRARDVYYEIARLFQGTDPGDLARERLGFIMKEGLTRTKEEAQLAKLFLGSEEDMDALAQTWLDEMSKLSETPPPGGSKQEEKKP